jgi:hypothetical protein
MSIKWRRLFARVIVALLVGVLAGCARPIVSSPNTFNVPADAAKHLRAGGNVALNNAYQAETKVTFFRSRSGEVSWVADLKQYTDTVITMLGREMQKKSVAVDPKAAKTVTLRVYDLSLRAPWHISLVLILEAQYGDGTKSTIKSENRSLWTVYNAVDGSLMVAVFRLLGDDKFLAYVNN